MRHFLCVAFLFVTFICSLRAADPVVIKLEGDRTDVDLYWIDSVVAISPDGKKIATASDENTAKIWDAESGKVLHSLEGHSGFVTTITFSPDGKKVVTSGHFFNAARIWDVETGKELQKLAGNFIAFSSDGTRIISESATINQAGRNRIVRLWDTESGKELQNLGNVLPVTFSPDGKKIFVLDYYDSIFRIWDTESRKELQKLEVSVEKQWVFPRVTFSPDGTKILACPDENANIIILDAESGKKLQILEKDAVRYTPIAAQFSPDGKRIVGTDDYSVRIWDTESGKQLQTIRQENRIFGKRIAFSPDSKRIVVWGKYEGSKTVQLLDAESGKELRKWKLGFAVFSPDGKKVVMANDTAYVIDAETGKELQTLGKAWFAAFSQDGNKVVAFHAGANEPGTAYVWTLE